MGEFDSTCERDVLWDAVLPGLCTATAMLVASIFDPAADSRPSCLWLLLEPVEPIIGSGDDSRRCFRRSYVPRWEVGRV